MLTPQSDRHIAATTQMRSFIEDKRFPCVGAKAALVRDALVFKSYGVMGAAAQSAQLQTDLTAYVDTINLAAPVVQSFVAIFPDAQTLTESDFETALWTQLRQLATIDRGQNIAWSDAVSSDPDHASFSMSVAGHPFFVVGLHPAASRAARRAPYEALVFNSTLQFAQLREDGRYDRLQSVIREREIRFNGSLNPMLAEFGSRSEARQYSGRAVQEGWGCPFVSATTQDVTVNARE